MWEWVPWFFALPWYWAFPVFPPDGGADTDPERGGKCADDEADDEGGSFV